MHSLVLLWLNDMRVVPRDCFLSPLLGELRKKNAVFVSCLPPIQFFSLRYTCGKKVYTQGKNEKDFFFFV